MDPVTGIHEGKIPQGPQKEDTDPAATVVLEVSLLKHLNHICC
jgi:hypothetical protein